MKELISEWGGIALALFLVVTLVLGSGTDSLKTQAGSAAQQNTIRMAKSNDW